MFTEEPAETMESGMGISTRMKTECQASLPCGGAMSMGGRDKRDNGWSTNGCCGRHPRFAPWSPFQPLSLPPSTAVMAVRVKSIHPSLLQLGWSHGPVLASKGQAEVPEEGFPFQRRRTHLVGEHPTLSPSALRNVSVIPGSPTGNLWSWKWETEALGEGKGEMP